MLASRSRPIAWTIFALASAAALGSVALLILTRAAPRPTGGYGFPGFSAIYGTTFAIVSLLIALRRPSHPVGWIMLVSGGLLANLQQVLLLYAVWTVLGDGTGPGGPVAAWVSDWIWLPQLGALGAALLLIPEGSLPSPRWRTVLWTVIASVGAATAARALHPGPIESFRELANPVGAEGLADALEVLYAAAIAVALGALVVIAVSLWLRGRGAHGDERIQIRLIASSGLLVSVVFVAYAIVFGLQNTGPVVDALEVAFVLSVIVFAVAWGVAILRFRLFDVEVALGRTVVFGVLAAFITLVYVAVVVGIGAFVEQRADAILSALAAALVAIAFQPVRRRARRLANRLVYGERASPYEVLSEFSQRVAGAYGAEDVLGRMARILSEGTGAARAGVWLRVGRRLELAASWPTDDGRPEPVDLPGDEIPALEGVSHTEPVRHEGELLGALTVTKPPGEPITSTERRLVQDLGHQAGLVLRNAALIADLRASRQRLVAAQDEERRRLERDLHDGAQQQLVSLSVKLGLLRRVAGDLGAKGEALVGELEAEAHDALETLRDLARGIFPPLLADRGLPAALEAQARKASLPVEIVADGVHRYPPAVEAAVYFGCLEALQNVAKYARATRAVVRLAERDGALTFQVSDDGVGFDVGAATAGTGLQGIRDRLAALDGTLEVRSAPGAGTSLLGRIPLAVG